MSPVAADCALSSLILVWGEVAGVTSWEGVRQEPCWGLLPASARGLQLLLAKAATSSEAACGGRWRSMAGVAVSLGTDTWHVVLVWRV